MAARRTERLLNLVICLLSTRRYLSANQIRELVPGYGPDDDDAFRRMFERDKEDLRELGIPLEVGSDSAWEDEPGYRIARRDYELPEISLAPDESAAVGLAARFFRQAGLGDAGSRALLKLRAAGLQVGAGVLTGLEPRFEAAEPAFEPLLAAVQAGDAVAFDYRTPGADEPVTRHLDLWGVVSWRGRWYAVGHDRDRAAERVFRLSRIAGKVRRIGPVGTPAPAGVDLRDRIAKFEGEQTVRRLAVVRVRPGTAWELRRAAVASASPTADWDEITVPFHHPQRFAEWVATYGADAVVLEPDEVRDAVIRRLEAAASLSAGTSR